MIDSLAHVGSIQRHVPACADPSVGESDNHNARCFTQAGGRRVQGDRSQMEATPVPCWVVVIHATCSAQRSQTAPGKGQLPSTVWHGDTLHLILEHGIVD